MGVKTGLWRAGRSVDQPIDPPSDPSHAPPHRQTNTQSGVDNEPEPLALRCTLLQNRAACRLQLKQFAGCLEVRFLGGNLLGIGM